MGKSVVYFLQSGSCGPIKIGVTTDSQQRLDTLQIGNPVRLAIMATIPGGVELERHLHGHFSCGLIANEWFERGTPGLLETVEHILRHGTLPSVPEPEPVGWCCETCRWPMEAELGEHGFRECWCCLKDRRDRRDAARLPSGKSAVLQVVSGD